MRVARVSAPTCEVFHKSIMKKYLGERRLFMRLPSILFFRPATSNPSGRIYRSIFNLYFNVTNMNSPNIRRFLSDGLKIDEVISLTEYAKNMYAASAPSAVKLKSFLGFESGIGHAAGSFGISSLIVRRAALSSGAASRGNGVSLTNPDAAIYVGHPHLKKARNETFKGVAAHRRDIPRTDAIAAFPIPLKSSTQLAHSGHFHEGRPVMRSISGQQSFDVEDQKGIAGITRSSFMNPSISSHRPKYIGSNDPRILSARQTDGASTGIKRDGPAPMLCPAGLIQLEGVEKFESARGFGSHHRVLKRFGNTPLSYGTASVVTPRSSGRDYAEKTEAAFIHRSRIGFSDYAELKREVGEIRNSFAEMKATVGRYVESVRESQDSGKPDINVLSDRIYRAIEQRLRSERERRGF